jgi:hypothetical protein
VSDCGHANTCAGLLQSLPSQLSSHTGSLHRCACPHLIEREGAAQRGVQAVAVAQDVARPQVEPLQRQVHLLPQCPAVVLTRVSHPMLCMSCSFSTTAQPDTRQQHVCSARKALTGLETLDTKPPETTHKQHSDDVDTNKVWVRTVGRRPRRCRPGRRPGCPPAQGSRRHLGCPTGPPACRGSWPPATHAPPV